MGAKKVRARAPMRVDLLGGWTDVEPFSTGRGSCVVSVAIDLYAYAEATSIDGERIVRAWSAGPEGAGLGSSGAMHVAMVGAIGGPADLEPGAKAERNYEIARQAYRLEGLTNRCGWQDHFSAVFGGVNVMESPALRTPARRRRCLPTVVRQGPEALATLVTERMVLCDTGERRGSADVHEDVWRRYAAGERGTVRGLKFILNWGRCAAERLDEPQVVLDAIRGTCVELGEISPLVTAGAVAELIADGRAAGAVACKPCGAGGGGCVAVFAEAGAKGELQADMEARGWGVWPVAIDFGGLVVEEIADGE